jgi:hypothetical protein
VWRGWHSISAKTHLVRGSMPCSLVSSAEGAFAGEVGCLGIAVGPGPVWVPATGDQCVRASRQHGSGHPVEQLGRCGSNGVVHGPWIDRERGRKSPTGRRCVLATRVGKHISTGWCGPFEDISASVCGDLGL